MFLTRPFRKPFWILNSFIQKRQKLLLTTALIGAFLFFFTKNLIPFLPMPKPHQKIGLVGQYTLQTLPAEISSQISRGLTQISPNGSVEPDLALSWEISDNNTVYRFFLDPMAAWSNGELIKSNQIEYQIPDVAVSYPDEHTIEFKLKEPFSPFLTTVSRPIFYKKNIGAGQYVIKKISFQGPYLEELKLLGPNNNLNFVFYPSNQSAWLGFKLGEINQLKGLFHNPLDENWQKKLQTTTTANTNQYIAILFNLNHPQLTSKPLRQALAYSIENKNPDDQTRALSPISPQSWAYNPNVKPYNFNPGQAQELFSQFENEASLSGQLELSISTSQSFLNLAEQIAQSWEKVLNIKTSVKVINSITDDFETLLIAQQIPPDPDQHALWHSTQPTNITHYSDLKVDKLLEDGRTTLDQARRQEIYQDFQRFLLEESPAIFLFHPTTYTIERQ